jgi:hypothetical protein
MPNMSIQLDSMLDPRSDPISIRSGAQSRSDLVLDPISIDERPNEK